MSYEISGRIQLKVTEGENIIKFEERRCVRLYFKVSTNLKWRLGPMKKVTRNVTKSRGKWHIK